MKHCPKCNTVVKDYHRFCEECGADLKKQIIPKPKSGGIKKVEKRPRKKVPSTEPKPRKAKSKVLEMLQSENKQLKEKLAEFERLIKELKKKARARPKTITRTITKTIIKKVPVTKTVVRKIPTPSLPLQEQEREIQEPIERFKLPKSLEGIKNLKIPEFITRGGR